jgi:D-serine deaminase-like pyridoxal phosphate-dependent protein
MKRLQMILGQIKYKDWSFNLFSRHDVPWLQLAFYAKDSTSGEVYIQLCREWKLSLGMTRTEVVQTALMAVLAAEEHEARETFTFKGVAVFQPHINVDEIAAAASSRQSPEDQLMALEALDPWRDLI